MWISVKRLLLGLAVLWSTVMCIASGVVVDTHEEEEGFVTDFMPVIQAHQDEQSDRETGLHDSEVLEGAIRDINEETETSYNPDDLSCTELRSKRYISDGFCTSTRPITEMVCVGECVPKTVLSWGADVTKIWGATKLKEWRCVNDVVRQRRVHLVCDNNETRTYRIRAVKSCKCKRYEDVHNVSNPKNTNEEAEKRQRRDEKRRDRQQQKRQNKERDNQNNNNNHDRKRRLAIFPADD